MGLKAWEGLYVRLRFSRLCDNTPTPEKRQLHYNTVTTDGHKSRSPCWPNVSEMIPHFGRVFLRQRASTGRAGTLVRPSMDARTS